jgi:hypothetical protein
MARTKPWSLEEMLPQETMDSPEGPVAAPYRTNYKTLRGLGLTRTAIEHRAYLLAAKPEWLTGSRDYLRSIGLSDDQVGGLLLRGDPFPGDWKFLYKRLRTQGVEREAIRRNCRLMFCPIDLVLSNAAYWHERGVDTAQHPKLLSLHPDKRRERTLWLAKNVVGASEGLSAEVLRVTQAYITQQPNILTHTTVRLGRNLAKEQAKYARYRSTR